MLLRGQKLHLLPLLLFVAFFLSRGHSGEAQGISGQIASTEVIAETLLHMAADVQDQIKRSGKIHKDTGLENYLNGIVRSLNPFPNSSSGNYRFKVAIIKDPMLNAFTLPNGCIYIHTGLLSRLENEAQLASLLAHEMSHVILQHPLKAFKAESLRQSPWEESPESVVSPSYMDMRASYGKDLYALRGYEERFEMEADLMGMSLVAETGYDPKGMPELISHLEAEISANGSQDGLQDTIRRSLKSRRKNCEGFLAGFDERDISLRKGHNSFLEKICPILKVNARLNIRGGRYLEAIKDMVKYLKIRYEDPEALFIMGEIFRKRDEIGDLPRAREYFLKAILTDPDYPAPYRALGIIHYKAGEWTLAKKWFEWFLDLSSSVIDRQYVRGYVERCREKEERL
ncbi:MAG: M48 family metalloprotease [Deltaproteobacteria bacterium]|nr:M48 family metalloprotease [Deltaproteobacteria bacterium]